MPETPDEWVAYMAPDAAGAADKYARKFRLDWWWKDALANVGLEAVWRAARGGACDATRGEAAARSFFYSTAARAMLDELRRWFHQRQKGAEKTGKLRSAPDPIPPGYDAPARPDPAPAFRSALAGYGATPADAAVLERVLLYGDTFREAAASLGLKCKSLAHQRYAAACRKLRARNEP